MLGKIEKLAGAKGPYLAGDKISWADLFMYPILADLQAIPGVEFSEKFKKWLNLMDSESCTQKTYEGTISYICKMRKGDSYKL